MLVNVVPLYNLSDSSPKELSPHPPSPPTLNPMELRNVGPVKSLARALSTSQLDLSC